MVFCKVKSVSLALQRSTQADVLVLGPPQQPGALYHTTLRDRKQYTMPDENTMLHQLRLACVHALGPPSPHKSPQRFISAELHTCR